MEERRVGPLTQLVWDLCTLPSLRASFAADPKPILAERGLDESVLPAIQGDQALLAKHLSAENTKLDEVHGPLPSDNLCRLVWGGASGSTAE
jgi:hypothetical protein